MFVALRDIRHAPGRFALIGAVIALMMLLVGFLTGLAGGLASQNISGILKTEASAVVANDTGEDFSWSTATVSKKQYDEWVDADAAVVPMGVAPTRLNLPFADDATDEEIAALPTDAATVYAFPQNSSEMKDFAGTALSKGQIALHPDTAEELGVKKGDKVTFGGDELTVGAVNDTGDHSHTPVAVIRLDDYHDYIERTRQPDRYASVLLVKEGPAATAAGTDGTAGGGIDYEALNAQAETQQVSLLSSLGGLEAFKSEIGTLGLMIGMLFGASALIVGVFFLVWSMQRSRDVAILKALGASNGWVRRDALGQSFIILAIGIPVGALAALGLGSLFATVAPFVVSWWTIVVPAVAMLIAGLIGSLFSLRQVQKADPMSALAALT